MCVCVSEFLSQNFCIRIFVFCLRIFVSEFLFFLSASSQCLVPFLFSKILSVVITLDHMMNFVKMSGFFTNKYYEKTYLSAVFSVRICWFLQQ